MLAKIPATSLPQLKRWATLVRLAKAKELSLAASQNSVTFSVAGSSASGYTASSNLYTRLTVKSEVSDEGSCYTNPGVFFEALATIQGEHCTVSFDGTDVSLTDEGSCCFGLKSLPSHNVAVKPLVADTEAVDWQAKLPGSDLKKVMERGAVCAGKAGYSGNQWRECLHIKTCGARLEFQSSDGFLLSRAHTEAEVQGEGEALVIASFAKAIAKILPDNEVTLKRQGQVLSLEGDNILIQIGLSAHRYPDTSKVAAPYRDNAATTVTLKVAEVKAVTERITAFCDGDTSRDNLALSISPTEVRTDFKNEAVGSFENSLEAEVSGESLELYLGAGLVRSILSAMGSEKLNLYIAAPESPVRLEPAVESPKETYILAPRSKPAPPRVEAKETAAS